MRLTMLALDDLASDWLARRITAPAALPGLNNDLGSIQVEADPVAFKHPVFPPYSAGNEITGLTLLNGRQVAQQTAQVEVRWRAFAIERRAALDAWQLTSRTTLLPQQPGVLVELRVQNSTGARRALELGLILSGRSRNTGGAGYNWSVPSIPTDMFSFREHEGISQTVSPVDLPGGRCFTNDKGTAHSIQCVWPAPTEWRADRVAHWRVTVEPEAEFVVSLLAVFHEDRAAAERLAAAWYGQTARAFDGAQAWWKKLWLAAFTPGNDVFSGHLPAVATGSDALDRLYYMGVLTLLTLRRNYVGAIHRPCYITLWPRRGEGSVYLPWELPYTSGLLARLDPAVLREMLLVAMSMPVMQGQMTNLFTGQHWGWGCCVMPHAIVSAGLNLVRHAGDRSWLEATVRRRPEGKAVTDDAADWPVVTGREAFREMVLMHRQRHLPGKRLVDYGSRHAYHECLTTYAHGTAAHTAVQAWALRAAGPVLGEDFTAEADELVVAVCELYRPGQGFFDCEHPDGKRHTAANLYDLGVVLNTIGDRLPAGMVAEIEAFARRELLTPTWAHCLSPADADVVDGQRMDHGWVGCFVAWPPQLAFGLWGAGRREPWLGDWIAGMARLTRQGAFGQGYWAEDLYPAECGAAAKCHDHLDGLMHWVIGSGAYFAELALEGVGVTP